MFTEYLYKNFYIVHLSYELQVTEHPIKLRHVSTTLGWYYKTTCEGIILELNLEHIVRKYS